MKKTLVVLLCIAMTLGILTACNKETAGISATATNGPTVTENYTAQPTDGATDQPTLGETTIPTDGATGEPTQGPTDIPTSGPTAKPTATPSSAPERKAFILNFDSGTVETLISQADLTSYGINKSELSLVTTNTDTGKGLKINMNNDSSRWCQALTYKDTAAVTKAFKDAKSYSYFRIWVYNPDSEEIGIAIEVGANSKVAMLSSNNAILTRADGKAVTTKVANSSGAGDYSIVVPVGFAGWIAWPTTAKLESEWGNPVPDSITGITSLKFDLRPQSPGAAKYYILDDVCFTDSAAGKTRSYSEPSKEDLSAKKKELDNMLNAFLSTTPKVKEMPAYNPDSNPSTSANEWSNIKAITYDGATINGKKTKVFAYIGFPQNASSTNKVPAIVLLHGGGGHAYAEWVKIWNDRGYAAIAMDNTGFFPSAAGKGVAGRESDYSKSPSYWNFGLYGDFAETGYVNAPQCDHMRTSSSGIDSQWMYHAVAQTILANNILRADSRVNSSKIGLTGISWGGIIASIAIGYDNRYAYAIPVYGSGYLDVALSYQKDNFAIPATKALWSAADKFANVSYPVLWLGWNNDNNFSINSNSLSYEATKSKGAILSMLYSTDHSHGYGWSYQESYRFADSIVKGGKPLTKVITEPGKALSGSFTISKPSDATNVTAKVYYLTAEMTYSNNGILQGRTTTSIDQRWQIKAATVSGSTVSYSVPSTAYSFYVEITTTTSTGTYITSTKYIELK